MSSPPDDESSEPLIRRALERDGEAIELLLERHLPGLRAFVRLNVDGNVRARESASDLAQSVCREFLENLDRFEYRGEAAFRGWLYSWALNKIRARAQYHHAQRRDPAREVPMPASVSDVAAVGDCYASIYRPSQQAMDREQLARVEAAFDRLSAEHRQIITMSRLVGLSHAEIAAKLGTSTGAVRSMLNRAMVRLTTILDPSG